MIHTYSKVIMRAATYEKLTHSKKQSEFFFIQNFLVTAVQRQMFLLTAYCLKCCACATFESTVNITYTRTQMFLLNILTKYRNVNILYRKSSLHTTKMAKSKFEYVKQFETDEKLLPNCWIVVRIDGRDFHKFSQKHGFKKPNDERALNLMNHAAIRVMEEFKDITIAYGESDEYSFVLRKNTEIYNRRGTKIMTYINSLFTSSFVYYWNEHFGDLKLRYPPAFDSRAVLYPTDENLRDYLSWRQADCHINNLYNTTFWTLINKGGLTNQEAEKRLSGTLSSDKNELLFSEFGMNYNNEPVMFKKGTILLRKKILNPKSQKNKTVILPFHEDLIGDNFWKVHSELLSVQGTAFYDYPKADDLSQLVMRQLKIETS